MPFLKKAGLGDGVEAFDFEVEGVTSISCDTVSRDDGLGTGNQGFSRTKNAFCPRMHSAPYISLIHSTNTDSVLKDHQSSCITPPLYVDINTTL